MTLTLERPAAADPGSAPEPTPRRRAAPEKIAALLTLVALVVASVVSLVSIDISIPQMLESWSNAQRFFDRVGVISFPEPGELLYLTALTVGLVLCGTLFAAFFSVPIAYLAAANTTPGRGWMAAARFLGVATRAVPDVVLAMVFVLMFSLGSLPGILAIGIHSIGMISKMFADAIEQIDEGPRLAIRATGGSRLQQFTAGVLPQVLPSWVATVLHRNDINLRGSVILGYVGVAGLGLEMSYAFKSLNYSLGLGIALVIFALCVVMEIVSSVVRAAMLGMQPTGRGLGDRLLRRLPRRPRAADDARRPWTSARTRNALWGWTSVAVVAGSVWICDIQWGDFLTVWGYLPETAAKFWPPSFAAYSAPVMFEAMSETIAIALAATILTVIASVVIGSLAARNVAPTPRVRAGMRLVLVSIRGIPEIILAIVLIVVTGLGAQAGTIALAIGGVGLLGKLLADSLEEVQPGPEQALKATGASRGQVYASATLPQGMKALIGHSFYMLDTNIRAATILGLVGGGGVGYYLLNAGQGSRYDLVTTIVLMILVTVLVVEGLGMWMRRVFR
ncbi:phosphate starvation-inducible protein PhoH [Cryobacterium roopkundense]|uniref:Phosphate starvation-inducible protein PhoH n=1 Tax=Cryobacterium roopkundense TaxID=1001240 RepID=A0A099JCB8_9MICO|nr:phosphonate ABC transporter, permease protein PhnE [Cryobacterium roopkundense]KGJ75142.1 phosphate starvation-inducible protein PhoH [Cryobacterium roopkundense]MBB5642943.1 phosphonate transport system permease protein [Cryobacterium roopkundense]